MATDTKENQTAVFNFFFFFENSKVHFWRQFRAGLRVRRQNNMDIRKELAALRPFGNGAQETNETKVCKSQAT